MLILGLSAFFHDSAAAIIKDGQIIAAVQEERFTRIKQDASFPKCSINYVLNEVGVNLSEVDHIIFYEKPFLKFERLLETYVSNAPKGFNSFRKAMPIWMGEKLFQKNMIFKNLKKIDNKVIIKNLYFSEHHISHAASAFYPSPFSEAIILTVDGVGEWATTTVAIGKENKIKIIKEIHYPHSIGLLYSAFTYYLGFKVNSGEYKVMGLAPYGEPIFKDLIINKIIDLKVDGSFRINQKYFDYSTNLKMINKKFIEIFGHPKRNAQSEKLSKFHMDIAASIQAVIEEIILRLVESLREEYSIENLCMAGGVALNCVMNSKILKKKYYKHIWIQPASGDAGGSLGCAMAMYYNELENPRPSLKKDMMQGAYLGPIFSDDKIKTSLTNIGANYSEFETNEMIKKISYFLSENKAIGWMQGRMEFGPRSLGSRSIIANPCSLTMQKQLNLKIKYRESFRPFAPSILEDQLHKWFDLDIPSPYMLFVAKILKEKQIKMTNDEKELFGLDKLNIPRSEVPAVTHVDYTARIQTVNKSTNSLFYSLIYEFYKITGCPMVVNTSFNVRGEPIVCTPEDAFNCFMGTELDVLVVGNFILEKNNQDKNLYQDYKNKYDLD